jgi:hypothetical protein
MADVGWDISGLVRPRTPEEPDMIELNDDAAALLDEAEDILNVAGPEILHEVERQRERERGESGLLGRIKNRFRRR